MCLCMSVDAFGHGAHVPSNGSGWIERKNLGGACKNTTYFWLAQVHVLGRDSTVV